MAAVIAFMAIFGKAFASVGSVIESRRTDVRVELTPACCPWSIVQSLVLE